MQNNRELKNKTNTNNQDKCKFKKDNSKPV